MLAAASAHAADRVLVSSPLLRSVDGYGGNLVWGIDRSFDEPGNDHFLRDARGTRRIPIDADVGSLDLGARRGGGTQAVFTSCRPRVACVLRTYDLRSGARRTLRSLSSPGGSELSPSAWKGRFAFERERLRTVGGMRTQVRGPSLGLFATSPLRAVTRVKTTATDLRGSRLAYVTFVGPRRFGVEGPSGTTTLYVATLPRRGGHVRSCLVARATDSASDATDLQLANPVLTADHVLWLRQDLRGIRSTDRRASIRRRRLPGHGCRSRGREERSREVGGMDSFAVSRGRFFYTAPSTVENSAQRQVREATDPRLTFTR